MQEKTSKKVSITEKKKQYVQKIIYTNQNHLHTTATAGIDWYYQLPLVQMNESFNIMFQL